MHRVLPIFILTACMLTCFAQRLHAEFFTIKNYDIHVRVDASGVFHVKEIIDVAFTEPRHGIFRTIPRRYDVGGENLSIKISHVEVENWPMTTSFDFNTTTFKIGDPDALVEGAQRYSIQYEVKHAWLFQKDHTEFYWNLVGTEWQVPIESVQYAVQFEWQPELTPEDYKLFTGYAGSTGQDATLEEANGTLRGKSTRIFEPGEGITLAVRLPVDAVPRPTLGQTLLWKYGLLSIPISLIAAVFGIWMRLGKDEEPVIMVEYYPPPEVTPSEAGAFLDDKVHNRDLTALLPYWAAEGFIEIREVEEKVLLIFDKTDYEFIRLKQLPAERPNYEVEVFKSLFSKGSHVRLSSLKDSFYTTMKSAGSKLQKAVHAREVYTASSIKRYRFMPLFFILGFAGAPIALFLHQIEAAIGFVIAGIFGVLMQRPILKRTKKGQDLYKHLKGFRMFIDKADRPRLERLLEEDHSYFEKTLPYAIAFGMATEWSKKFDGLFSAPPTWYFSTRPQAASFGTFAEEFSHSMKQVESVFTSAPKSSSSGSGGSSGGGFGGGGGGSW